jgi:hypothetical protein
MKILRSILITLIFLLFTISTVQAANFHPFSGGLDGGAAGDLDKRTGVSDKDVAVVALKDYTGSANEGPLNGINVGNIVFFYTLSGGGGSGDDWPNYGESGDANDRWEYAGIYQIRTEFIPIGWAIDGSSGPQSLETIISTNKTRVRRFDGTDGVGDEDVQINWMIPQDFLPGYGKVKFRVVTLVTESTIPSSTGWSFFLQGAAITTGETLSSSLGTAVESNSGDRSDSQYDLVFTSWSSETTITGLTAGEFGITKLYRDVSDADDDYEQDIGVIGIEIKYPAKMTGVW